MMASHQAPASLLPAATGSSASLQSPVTVTSPSLSQRISSFTPANQRRRVLFPTLKISKYGSSAPTTRPALEESKGDSPDSSPRVVWETLELVRTNKTPALPLLGSDAATTSEHLVRSHATTTSTCSLPASTSPPVPKRVMTTMSTCLLQEDTEHSDDPWCHHPCPRSILRSLRFATSAESVDKIPSVESDMPSLAESSQSAGSCGGELLEEELLLFPAQLPNSRAKSVGSSRTINFDPRVWVREFERDPDEREVTWYSSSELEAFKVAAVERIVAFSQTELVATGTGRMVPKRSLRLSKPVFSHTALGTEYEMKLENLFRAVLQNELRRILVVDSHDIFLQLFAKGLQKLVPHAEIVLAGSSQVALVEAAKGRFDVVLVEERLKFLHQKGTSATASCTDAEARSGTALMKRLQGTLGRAIYIGVSAKYKEDVVLMRSVADLCWSKPPPKMDAVLLREILHKLLSKRERFHAISELYATSC